MLTQSKPKLLDCTFRDGGYYTQWDFTEELVNRYLSAIRKLPVETVELGYCSPVQSGYFGKHFFLSPTETQRARDALAPWQSLAVMLDEKAVDPHQVPDLLGGHRGIVDIVRIAVAPGRLAQAAALSRQLRSLGFRVGVNIMYLSSYWDEVASLEDLDGLAGSETVSLVDSYGACTPEQVRSAVLAIRNLDGETQVGFHGHDNLGLAVANSLAAVEAGAAVIDGTVLGMGRGPGNARIETLIVHQAKYFQQEIDYPALSEAIDALEPLHERFRWGTNLVYMISGAAGLPQNNVMEWLGKRRYSIPAIIRAIQGRNTANEGEAVVQKLQAGAHPARPVIIIGGGESVAEHSGAVSALAKLTGALLIHASIKHLDLAPTSSHRQYLALAGDAPASVAVSGSERHLEAVVVPNDPRFNVRDLGIPDSHLRSVEPFGAQTPAEHGPVSDSAPLALALGVALELHASEITLVGFDGYERPTLAEQDLARETQSLIDEFQKNHPEIPIQSGTRTLYSLSTTSIYALVQQARMHENNQ